MFLLSFFAAFRFGNINFRLLPTETETLGTVTHAAHCVPVPATPPLDTNLTSYAKLFH